ncbi:MAG: hypothetical protein H6Q73_3990 [Firmicutes bacterium]|nr:hypothetical protein [Bacillota bacterium]
MFKEYVLGFGNSNFTASFSAERVINEIEGKAFSEITDVASSVRAALNDPIGSPALNAIVQKGEKIAIIASDITRHWIRHDLFLPIMLDELNAAGIPDSDITLMVALGTHRHHTNKENLLCYGREVVERITIMQSNGLNSDDFSYVGTTSRGTETYINSHIVNADKVILTGGIVYHAMAGFGGGRKSILPGVCGYSTIQANHRFCLSAEVGQGVNTECETGKLANNPMHEDAMEIAALVKPDFILNVVLTPEGGFARFVAGAWEKAWLEGCKTVKEIFGIPIKEKTDLVIASAGGFPKDINLYQGVKTICNACLAAKPEGVVIVLLECRDIAEPPEFSGWFEYDSLYEHELSLRQEFTVPGFIALKVGYIAQQIPLIIVTLPENKIFIEKAGMIPATTLDEALLIAEEKLNRKDYTISVISHGANTVPIFE